MTRFRLVLRSIRYFRWADLAIAAGMAVAAAVLAGALMVGDSVRASLRDIALRRLGPVDHALAAASFFPQDLAARLESHPDFATRFHRAVAGISVRGGAGEESGELRIGGVQVLGVGEESWVAVPPGRVLVNAELADLLKIPRPGQGVLLNLPVAADTPRDAVLIGRGRSDLTTGLRADVQAILRERGFLSMFSLTGSQREVRNVWMNFAELQSAIGQPARANLLLVQARPAATDEAAAAVLNRILRQVVRLEDYGLRIDASSDGKQAILNSRATYLAPAVEQAAEEAGRALGLPLCRVSTYLANRVTRLGTDSSEPEASGKKRAPGSSASSETTAATRDSVLHYCVVAGISNIDGLILGPDEIAANQWTAQQLGLSVGDRLRLEYYQRQPDGLLRQVASDREGLGLVFRVARVLPMSGLGADASLTPVYRGLTDADSIADWQPPQGVYIDKRLVTRADEQYWERYRAAPKLLINLSTARRLWGNTYGDLTSIRVPRQQADPFARELLRRLDPASMGLLFQPVKAEQLAASSGSTDFAALFIGFSFFLIVSAGLLVAMLFRLGIEQRARQIGLLSALGFSRRELQQLLGVEGMILALIGGLGAAPLGIAYTALMIWLLRTRWVDAVGTTALVLDVRAGSLAGGICGGVLLAGIIVFWALRRLSQAEPALLLVGGWASNPPYAVCRHRRRWGALLLVVGILLAALACVLAGVLRPQSAGVCFLASGSLLLLATLVSLGCLVGTGSVISRAAGSWSLLKLSWRNTMRQRARSLLTTALIASASFILVTVASMRQRPPTDTHRRDSGTGGFQIIVQADLPLPASPGTAQGRDLLGIREMDSPLWDRAHFIPMRSWAGQDVSCLNLTRPGNPAILAVPEALIQRGAFSFASVIRPVANPWTLLGSARKGAGLLGPGEIPVIADNETASYILKIRTGQTLQITDQLGRRRTLRLVGTLSHSIFQSELLIGEADFLGLFPTQSGFSHLLVEVPAEDEAAMMRLLSSELEDFAATAERTAGRLARYQQVANTYLSTFQALGSLGLMLGTVGLAVVLLRNLIERRGELALLSAVGFSRQVVLALMLAENLWLLLGGLLAGVVSSLMAVLPARRPLNLSQAAASLGLTVLVGLLVLAIATPLGLRRVRPADLRAE